MGRRVGCSSGDYAMGSEGEVVGGGKRGAGRGDWMLDG